MIEDPTESKGFPFPNEARDAATFLPFGDLEKLIKADKPLVCFMDDLGQAPASVQAAKMQLVLKRQIGQHKISDFVTFVAATNRRSDRAGVSGILGPLKRRFKSILELTSSVPDWIDWAFANDQPIETIAFMQWRGLDLLLQPETQDIANTGCPRGWGNVGDIIKSYPIEVQPVLITGAVGDGAGGEFNAFREAAAELPNPVAILANPDTALIPEKDSVRWALASCLASHANLNNFDRFMTYLDRWLALDMNEWATVMGRDALRRTPQLANHPAFIKAQSGPLGKIFLGQI